MNSIFKPGECLKHVTVEMHPSLLDAWYCGDVRREVMATGASVTSTPDICNPALVMWVRTVPPALAASKPTVPLMPVKESCDNVLYVMNTEDTANYVAERKLSSHILRVKDMVGCSLTFVVFGTKDYFKASGRKTQNSSRKIMKEIDLEMAITDLLVSSDCDTVVINTPNELALLIAQYTKAIAEAPYKKAKRKCDEQADFYMRGDNKQCVALDKKGNGKSRLWQQMVAVLPSSSLETSRAICAVYKTPLALHEATKSSSAISEIADIEVARAAVPGTKGRRVGPEFARKLHTLFSAENGDTLIN